VVPSPLLLIADEVIEWRSTEWQLRVIRDGEGRRRSAAHVGTPEHLT
jgi:hypothetical protein